MKCNGLIATIIPLTLLSGCYDVPNYSGDGKLIDNGASSATDRFIIDLGGVDTTKSGSHSYRFTGLPQANFVFGLKVQEGSREKEGGEPTNPSLSISLTEGDVNIFSITELPLRDWTWSTTANGSESFVYIRGQPGTYFQADPDGDYTLTLSIDKPSDSGNTASVRLIAKSGGWK